MNDVSPRGSLSVTSAEVCDRGKVREENQDSVRRATIALGELFIVADGIGGYLGGATASRMVVEGFDSQLAARSGTTAPERALQEACDFTNASIHAAATSSDPSLLRMGSTVVVALVQASSDNGPVAWVGHVGDSRAYLIRNGQMRKLTSDHSAVQALIDRQVITEEEARNHPDASVLTRSLGHRPEVEMEIDRVQLNAGDALLLCSDGLWGYVADGDIAAVATDSSLSVQTIVETLLHQAMAAGGLDNIGIEFLRIAEAKSQGVASPNEFPPHQNSRRNQQVLAIGLLLLGGLGGLAYAAHSNNWFNVNGLLRRDPVRKVEIRPVSPASGKLAPNDKESPHTAIAPKTKPLKPGKKGNGRTIEIVGTLPRSVEERRPSKGAHVWKHVSMKHTDLPACAAYARPVTVVYSDRDVDRNEMVEQIADLKERIKDAVFETDKFDQKVKEACGNYDVVVILPRKRQTAAPTGETPDSVNPTQQQSHPQGR